jgi:hypothetical protein
MRYRLGRTTAFFARNSRKETEQGARTSDGNVVYAKNMVNSAFSDLYHANGASNGYDSLNQLAAFAQGALSDTNSDGVPDTVASPSDSQSWALAALGNPSSVTTNGTSVSRASNAQNETTSVGSATLTYDANGNMTIDAAGRTLVYDAWNRLVVPDQILVAFVAKFKLYRFGGAEG